MKKWYKVLGVVLATCCLVVITAFIYIKTLDINKIIPKIQQAVQQQTGRSFLIGNAKLDITFSGGVVLVLDDVSLSEDFAIGKDPFIKTSQIDLSFNWMRYLTNKEVSIGRIIVVEPFVSVIKMGEEQFNFTNLFKNLTSKSSQDASNEKITGALPLLLVDQIQIKNGKVNFEDRSGSSVKSMSIDKINLGVSDFSLHNPFKVYLQAQVFAKESNFKMQTELQLEPLNERVNIKQGDVTLNLDDLNLQEIENWVPALNEAQFEQQPKGVLSVAVKDVALSARGVPTDTMIKVSLTDGELKTAYFPELIEKIELTLEASLNKVDIKKAHAVIDGGELLVQGVVVDYLNYPVADLKIFPTKMPIDSLAVMGGFPWPVEGSINGELSFFISMIDQENVLKSIKSRGEISSSEIVFKKINALSVLLDQMSIIPGMSQKLYVNLPEKWQDVLGRDDTLVHPITFGWTMVDGLVSIPQVDFKLNGLFVEAKNINFTSDQTYHVDLKITIDPELASAMVKSAAEIKNIIESDGSIRLPGYVQGRFPDEVDFGLDKTYLKDKLIRAGTQMLLKELIDKNPEVDSGATEMIDGLINGLFRK